MLIAKKIAFICLISIPTLVGAQNAPVNQLEDLLKPITSIKAKFKQTVLNKQGEISQSANGGMEFKRPSSFRWQIVSPDPTLIITDGKKLWNYDVELEQVTVQNFKASNEVSPISFLFDDVDKLAKNFNVIKIADNSFKLTPREENPGFISIEISFNQGKIKQLRLLDHLGQTSVFDFEQVQNNPKIASDSFTFTPPAGVDVIGE